MARIPGTFTKSNWEILPNPAYEGREPTILQAACHDRTPFITIACDCGNQLHIHESQTLHIPDGEGIASRCNRCRKALIFPSNLFKDTFQKLREQGWIE